MFLVLGRVPQNVPEWNLVPGEHQQDLQGRHFQQLLCQLPDLGLSGSGGLLWPDVWLRDDFPRNRSPYFRHRCSGEQLPKTSSLAKCFLPCQSPFLLLLVLNFSLVTERWCCQLRRDSAELASASGNVMNTLRRCCKRSISCRGFLWRSYPHDSECFPEVISAMASATSNLIAGFICTEAGASDSISFNSRPHGDIGVESCGSERQLWWSFLSLLQSWYSNQCVIIGFKRGVCVVCVCNSSGWLRGGLGQTAPHRFTSLQGQSGDQLRGFHSQGGRPLGWPQDWDPERHPPAGQWRSGRRQSRKASSQVGLSPGTYSKSLLQLFTCWFFFVLTLCPPTTH